MIWNYCITIFIDFLNTYSKSDSDFWLFKSRESASTVSLHLKLRILNSPSWPGLPTEINFWRRSQPRKPAHRSEDNVSLNKLPQTSASGHLFWDELACRRGWARRPSIFSELYLWRLTQFVACLSTLFQSLVIILTLSFVVHHRCTAGNFPNTLSRLSCLATLSLIISNSAWQERLLSFWSPTPTPPSLHDSQQELLAMYVIPGYVGRGVEMGSEGFVRRQRLQKKVSWEPGQLEHQE